MRGRERPKDRHTSDSRKFGPDVRFSARITSRSLDVTSRHGNPAGFVFWFEQKNHGYRLIVRAVNHAR